jgi:hypothetical protein
MARNPLGVDTSLLTFNAKQQKTYEQTGVVVFGLELASGVLKEPGKKPFVLCPTAIHKDLDCKEPGNCVRYGGNGRFDSVTECRERRTVYLRDDRASFTALLESEMTFLIQVAKLKGLKIAFRLNTFSDLNWNKLIRKFPDVIFFDYTKELPRFISFLKSILAPGTTTHPTNYHLCYSMHEHSSLKQVLSFIKRGGTVSFLYHGTIPETFHGIPVLDGDSHDLRCTDLPGHFIALHAKAGMRKLSNRASKFLQIVS